MQRENTSSPRPSKVPFLGLPEALKPLAALPCWLVWRWENNKGKWTKVPYQARRPQAKASSIDKSTWSDYDTALSVVETHDDVDGLGLCLLGATGLAAFDLDDCRDPATGAIAPWARALVDRCASYTEVTVSGTGLRIIGHGVGPEIHRQQPTEDGGKLETYRGAKRYIVITGNALNEHELEDIDEHIDAVVAEWDEKDKTKKKQKKPRAPRRDKGIPRHLLALLHIPNAGAGAPTGDYPDRSAALFGFINLTLRAGVADEDIVAATLDAKYTGKAIYEHVQEHGGEEYVKRQIERALNEPPTGDSPLVIIRIKAGELDKAWRATEHALIAANCPVYVCGGKLVQPLWRWEQTKDNDGSEHQVLTAQFVRFNIPRLADVTAHHAVQFQKWNEKDKRYNDIDPPEKLIQRLIEIGHWGFPTVVGLINSPTMRPDGSLLTTPGYDPATQLWYKSSGDVILPPIPEHPTQKDAEMALALLNGLLDGFPFEGETEENQKSPSRSAALAGIMTTVLRGALPAAVPLFAIVGTEPRTGKTYLVTLIAFIATGHVPISVSGSEKKEELEKRIETAALSGRLILHLNNLPNGMVVESERLSESLQKGWYTSANSDAMKKACATVGRPRYF